MVYFNYFFFFNLARFFLKYAFYCNFFNFVLCTNFFRFFVQLIYFFQSPYCLLIIYKLMKTILVRKFRNNSQRSYFKNSFQKNWWNTKDSRIFMGGKNPTFSLNPYLILSSSCFKLWKEILGILSLARNAFIIFYFIKK